MDLKQFIQEEVSKLHTKTLLENKKTQIEKELKILKEEFESTPSVEGDDERNELISLYSDMHKSAYGFRLRHSIENWTTDEIRDDLERFSEKIKADMSEEKEIAKENVIKFEELIQKTIDTGAEDRTTALRWLYDGSGIGGPHSIQDIEHYLWQNGILFTDEGEKIKQEFIEIYGNK